MIQHLRTACLHLKCHRAKIIGTHTAGHSVYWGIECFSSHSLVAGGLAGALGVLTLIVWYVEET